MFQAVNICKSYQGRPILDRVNLALPAGFCLGVTGKNGAGKTTLLSILAQSLSPDRGDLRFQGRSVRGDRQFLRKKLGYVPQYSDLVPEFTAREQLTLWQRACGCPDALPGPVAEALGLEELLDIRTGEMSGGMRKRVSIAMAMAPQPEILIMDEITTGLDDRFREDLLRLLERHLAQGGRMVWCSHISSEMDRLCASILPLTGNQP